MTRRTLLAILFAALLFVVGGITVKRGPASPTLVHEESYYLQNATATVGNCVSVADNAATGSCLGTAGDFAHPVNEPNYTGVTIHSLRCFWEDGAWIIVDDSTQFCVAYRASAAVTNTTSCVTWTHTSAGANTNGSDIYTTSVNIPSNDFGLLLRVIASTDVGSQWRGTCTIQYSGYN